MKKLLYTVITILLILFTLCSCGEDDDLSEKVAAYRAEKMARYEAENEQYADYEVDVAFLGDSLTDMGYEALTAQITPVIERQLSAWYKDN